MQCKPGCAMRRITAEPRSSLVLGLKELLTQISDGLLLPLLAGQLPVVHVPEAAVIAVQNVALCLQLRNTSACRAEVCCQLTDLPSKGLTSL